MRRGCCGWRGERVVLFDGEGHWVAGKVAMGKGRRVVVDVAGGGGRAISCRECG